MSSELVSHYYPVPDVPDVPRNLAFNVITHRRREVLVFSALGLEAAEIGRMTGSTQKAVKAVREDLRRLFASGSMTEVVLKAVEKGELDLDRLTEGFDSARFKTLTPGERRVLLAMGSRDNVGKTHKEIAVELDLAPKTIKGVQRRICAKLDTNGDLQNRLYLMRAQKEGLIELTPSSP